MYPAMAKATKAFLNRTQLSGQEAIVMTQILAYLDSCIQAEAREVKKEDPEVDPDEK